MQSRSSSAPGAESARYCSPEVFGQAVAQNQELLATHLPGDQHRLAEMLAQLLAAIRADSEGMPATESRLTSRGFPMEFAYVWPADSFRVTTDLLPGGTARQRLIKSLNWTGPFQHSYQRIWIQLFQNWLQEYGGRYGAWVGSRCKDDRICKKLYLEVAAEAPWRSWEAELLDTPQLPDHIRLVMVGLNPNSGEFELYYRMDRLNLPGIAPLFRRHQLLDRSVELIEWLRRLTPGSIRFEIPSSNLGYSVSYTAAGQATALTLYSVADSLLGGDSMIRDYSLNLGRRAGWNMDLYAAATQALASGLHLRDAWHGMLGLVAPAQGPIQYTIGWTPYQGPTDAS